MTTQDSSSCILIGLLNHLLTADVKIMLKNGSGKKRNINIPLFKHFF